ncbi:hypothetical protein BDQ94DRAFT_134515 [Aspergillus welwitschiae]|uniref:Uncharacterized protein n=1 Tax=Aspergillus welwitschiae TaxID=1341132 RepID=A0A3F3QIG6_9EURO|nr:hypothetical protein BDQ94DRAFT_134515 [Aspergillus welwitschiae]RDH38739.1 hypothetical protein BDQ94DRAFT_134515 [Aspergillus welwitschiae]
MYRRANCITNARLYEKVVGLQGIMLCMVLTADMSYCCVDTEDLVTTRIRCLLRNRSNQPNPSRHPNDMFTPER